MPRSAAQSDFVVAPAEPEPEELAEPVGPISPATTVIELPRARVRTKFASARATKLVFAFMWVVFAILAVLTIVGPHIPAGE